MRFLHLADLHIGKSVCEFPMLEDQRHVLGEVVSLLGSGDIDCLLVAGDLYDKTQPSSQAVALVDWFLGGVAGTGVPAVVIPGNHDSAERVAYAGDLLSGAGIHVAPVFDGTIAPVRLSDEHGPVNVWPIPFLRPAEVRHAFDDCSATSYTDAMRHLVGTFELDPAERNVAVVHQFVTATGTQPERTDSELSLGGMDNVDFEVFDSFDYVACGHVHRPQRVGRDACRYAGSPLKYSLSEAAGSKSAPVVSMGAKGEGVSVSLVPLTPLHDLRKVVGPLEELLSDAVVGGADHNDYLHVVLTDQDPIPNALGRLRDRYPNVMSLEYDNSRTRAEGLAADATAAERPEASPLELFEDFFAEQNGRPMSDLQREVVADELGRIVGEAM